MAAVITEHPRSGEGNRRGVGVFEASRLFIVQVDAVGDSPEAALQAVHPIGTPHPDDDYAGLFINDYERVQNLEYQARLFLVRVNYSLPLVALQDEWTWSESPATEFREIVRDLNGRLIGSRYYAPVLIQEDIDNGLYTHTSYTRDGAIVYLNQVPRSVTQKPTHAFRRVTNLTARRQVPNYTLTMRRVVNGFTSMVNSTAFRNFNPLEVMFMGATIEGVSGSLVGQFTDGVIYDVTLEFLAKPFDNTDNWERERIYDTVESGDFVSPVFDKLTNEWTYADYIKQNRADLNQIFTVFQSGLIRIGGPGQP